MARYLKTSGEASEVHPAKGKKFKLEELQRYVGGYIELVRLDKRQNMVVNEEGRIQGLPLNQHASMLAGQTIVGDVIICGPGEM